MNQQNKTERWVEEFDKEFVRCDHKLGEFAIRKANGDYHRHGLVAIKDFISQLLSDARREERNNIEDTTKALLKDVAYQAQIRGYSTNDWYFKGQQNAYQQILTILSQSQSDQSLTTAEENIKKLK